MLFRSMKDRGISEDHIHMMRYCGIDFEKWLAGFDSVETSVKESVDIIKNHPLIPTDVKIHGFIMDSVTGALTQLEEA